MQDHAESKEAIAAYVAARLGPLERSRVECHLSSCVECAETVAAWRAIASAIRDGGEEIFEPHPGTEAIRRHSLGQAAGNVPLLRHIESCASCSLEAQAWRTRAAAVPTLAKAGRWHGWSMAFGAAAGIAIGVGLALLPRVTHWPSASSPQASPVTPAVQPAPSWSGAVPLLVLAPARRGGAESPAEIRIDPRQPGLVIAVKPIVPDDDPERPYAFRVAGANGAVVWSWTMTAGAIREQIRRNDDVTLAVPATALPPGRYELQVVEAGGTSGPSQRFGFAIVP